MEWNNMEIPIKSINTTIKETFYIQDSLAHKKATNQIKKILDATYDKADFHAVINQNTHLSDDKQKNTFKLT
jgi:hypothetical protein